MVTRRTFLQGLAAGAAALVLPPTLTDNAEAARRFWALESTMIPDRWDAFARWVEAFEPRETPLLSWNVVVRGPEHLGLAAYQVAAYRERPDLPLATWKRHQFVRSEYHTSPVVFEADAHRAGTNARDEAIRLLAREMAGRA